MELPTLVVEEVVVTYFSGIKSGGSGIAIIRYPIILLVTSCKLVVVNYECEK